jgi:hypothetical protein
MGQTGRPAEPGTPAPPATPGMPAPDAPPGPDALDLASIAKRRYGKFLSDEQTEELTKALDRGVQGGTALRKAKLANSDEPDFIFRALD